MSIGSRLDDLIGRLTGWAESVCNPGAQAERLPARLVWQPRGTARLHVRLADIEAFASCMIGRRWICPRQSSTVVCPSRRALPASYVEAHELWVSTGRGPAPSLAVMMAQLCRSGAIPQGYYFID